MGSTHQKFKPLKINNLFEFILYLNRSCSHNKIDHLMNNMIDSNICIITFFLSFKQSCSWTSSYLRETLGYIRTLGWCHGLLLDPRTVTIQVWKYNQAKYKIILSNTFGKGKLVWKVRMLKVPLHGWGALMTPDWIWTRSLKFNKSCALPRMSHSQHLLYNFSGPFSKSYQQSNCNLQVTGTMAVPCTEGALHPTKAF